MLIDVKLTFYFLLDRCTIGNDLNENFKPLILLFLVRSTPKFNQEG